MNDMRVFWGDFHKHLEDVENADEIIGYAKYNLDVYCVLCYPFKWERIKGALVETVGQRQEFLEWWEKLREAARKHNEEGRFVTFLGYEWHGNRTHYGDHNVIYFEDGPLDDSWEIEDLFQNLRGRRAMAIPHHTGYIEGHRGKNWNYHDPDLSPVMEVFSAHGSSEAIDGLQGLTNNRSMGPRASGGTFVDALDRGIRIGLIASNDGAGLPGSWPRGIAGIWAQELSREAIWEALKKRRTFGTTGDRISLWLQLNGEPMGAVIRNPSGARVKIDVEGVQPVELIELIHNGRVCSSHHHPGSWDEKMAGEFKILVEFGWGPSTRYGFRDVEQIWRGRFRLDGGRLLSVQPRFSMLGQSYLQAGEGECEFSLKTRRNDGYGFRQGMVLRLEGDEDTVLGLSVEGEEIELRLSDTITRTHLFPLLEESGRRVESEFGIVEGELRNPDIYYHNARKIRVHPSYPEESYLVHLDLEDVEISPGNNYYYARVRQIDGQMAWSSPMWIEN